MAEVTDVDITNGIPSAGTGTVPTLSKTNTVIGAVNESAPGTDTASAGLNGRLQRIAQRVTTLIASTLATSVADGADVTLGAKADAKSTATDTTAVTAMSVLKQISASIQAAATSLAGSLTVGTHAVTQSGTWTVQPGNTANTTAWKVDGSAVTHPVSNSALTNFGAGEYETVTASATTQSLGATGAAGDWIDGLLVVPATTSPGNVLLRDGVGSDITLFAGGASSVSNLVPFFIPLGMISGSGAWKVTTGSNVSCIGIGNFT